MSNLTYLTDPVVEEFLVSDIESFEYFLTHKSYSLTFAPHQVATIDELKRRLVEIKTKEYVKNQHYVPQFYLRLFANQEGRLETLDLKLKKIVRPQATKNVCSGMFFYSVKLGEKSTLSQVLEDYFCYFENRFCAVYEKLVEDIIQDKQLDMNLIQ